MVGADGLNGGVRWLMRCFGVLRVAGLGVFDVFDRSQHLAGELGVGLTIFLKCLNIIPVF